MANNQDQTDEEPLLSRKRIVYEGCPGCKCMPHEGDEPPVRQLVLISFVMLCNALPISILFPYLYFMIQDFHIAKSTSDIGYYAGWVGSSFMIGRCLTGWLWGLAADRYGRKPVLFCGIISVLVFNALFGFSTTYWMAIAIRFCLGSMNGMLGTIQTVASEICTKKYQSLGMAVVSTMWGFGLIVGPALGGFLAQPALKYPGIFTEGSLFERFPYLLPPLCVSAFAFVALVACYLLPETLHNHDQDNGYDAIESGEPLETEKRSIFQNRALVSAVTLFAFVSLHDIAYTEIFSLWAVSSRGLAFSSSDIGRVLTVAGCGMLVCQLGVFPRVTRRVGPTLVTRAAAALTIPLLFVYPLMPKLDGAWLWVVVLLVSTLKYILLVIIFRPSAFCDYQLSTAILIVSSIYQEATATGLAILINACVRQEERGTANGLSLSMLSLFKAIGPAAGGSIFAWSQKRFDAHFLPGNQLVFFFLGVWILLVFVGTFEPFLPHST